MTIKVLYDQYHAATNDLFHEKRDAFLAEVERLGVVSTLTALGFPTDRAAVWYNFYTGSEATLHDMLTHTYVGQVHRRDEPEELGYILEHWLPKTSDPNPVMARSLAISATGAAQLLADHLMTYIEETSTAEAFVERVADQGGTMQDGKYSNSPKAKGKAHVELHDGREFTFPLREIWRQYRNNLEQPTLFSL